MCTSCCCTSLEYHHRILKSLRDSEVTHLLYIGTETEANEICISKVSEEAFTESMPYAKEVLLAAM